MNNLTDSEKMVALAGIILVVVVTVVRCFQWFWDFTPRPDPWGPEVDAALDDPEVLPVCHHCSAPHAETARFCLECGAAVGDYNNWNPYHYIFSLGEVLRAGTFGKVQRSWFTVLGYFILSVGEYMIFAPIYWVLLAMNLASPPLPPSNNPASSESPP